MSADAPVPPVPVLKDIIWERFIKALDIKRRLHVMRAFTDELVRTSRGQTFSIRNDIVWNAMLDVRDKLVIDLYSLTVEMRHGIEPPGGGVSRRFLRKRGLFIEVRDHHLASLTRSYVAPPSRDPYLVSLHTKSRAEAFARLFPTCTADSPSAADVEDLCERFRVQLAPVGDDRNKNRAHALEGEAGTVAMLSMPALDAVFKYVEGVIEDMSIVSQGAAFARQDLNHADPKETARDLVDQILFGHVSDVNRLLTKRTRDELYARLHEIDDNPPPPDPEEQQLDLRFNDRHIGPPFEEWMPVTAVSPTESR